MAERRMFAKTIIDSDAFLDMPPTAQLLYFHLAMRADDDGFINKPKSIMKSVGSRDDDLKLLIAKKFVISFPDGIVVIKHWRIHNYIRKDTYNETNYKDDKGMLALDENKAYTLVDGLRQLSVDGSLTQDRLGKDRLGKDSIEESSAKRKRFAKPSVDEVKAYCNEKGYAIDAQHFIDYYESNGWKVGKNPMKDWKATVRTWASRERSSNGINSTGVSANNSRTSEPSSIWTGN